ncbi:MAG: glycerol-3-phosphate 1-O-acyltransferase PlsB [Oligoflexus sp.]
MSFVKQQLTALWVMLLKPIMLWIVTRPTPENPRQKLELTDDPIIYILPRKSYIDRLVLVYNCRRNNLPVPEYYPDFRKRGSAACLFLKGSRREVHSHQTPHLALKQALQDAQKRNVERLQVVPVSPFWGKNPGREESSIGKLLFNHDEGAGRFQKFLIVLFQGRNNTVYFSKPVVVENLGDRTLDIDRQTIKLQRVFKLHFRHLRNTVLGQRLYDREQVINRVALGRGVRPEIDRELASKKTSVRNLETRARRYARELAADQTYSMVRFFEIVLGRLWNKIFDGVEIINVENVTRYARQNYEIVYVPTHRSHLDYLLTSYTVYQSGLPVPHIAAGINLNFWPIGWFLRRAGAFFIRRSFRGNRLYSAVVNEYIHFLLTEGYPITFFPEGGRSRTGRLLSLKTGMLSMMVQSFVRNSEKPIALVPVYIGYDKVMEVGSYLTELSGSSKKKESIFQLFQARKLLRAYYGKAYVSYGEPILLNKFLNEHYPKWQNDIQNNQKPDWLAHCVQDLSKMLATRMNQTAVLSPVALVGVGLLSSWQKALPKDELASFIDLLIEMHKRSPYHLNVKLALHSSEEVLQLTDKMAAYSNFEFAGGDVVHVNELQGILISYYRNNIIHLIAIPSLIARFFKHQDIVSETELCQGVHEIYPILKEDFCLSWQEDDIVNVVKSYAAVMVELGLMVREGVDQYKRPSSSFDQFENLSLLGNAMGLTFERYTLTAALLAKHHEVGYVEEEEFEHQCQKMTQRLAILNGINNPEFVEKSFIQKQIQLMKRRGLLKQQEDGRLLIDDRVATLAKSSRKLLSYDARFSIDRIFASKS